MKRVRSNNEHYTASNEDQTFIEHDLPFRFAFLTADVEIRMVKMSMVKGWMKMLSLKAIMETRLVEIGMSLETRPRLIQIWVLSVRPDRIARFRLFDERQVSGGSLQDVRA